jgi:hypothetical protein
VITMKFARLARADRVQGPKPGHSAPMVLESERPGEVREDRQVQNLCYSPSQRFSGHGYPSPAVYEPRTRADGVSTVSVKPSHCPCPWGVDKALAFLLTPSIDGVQVTHPLPERLVF